MKPVIRFICMLLPILSFGSMLHGQEKVLLTNKSGTFKLIDWGVYPNYNCDFTR